jgi:hypothetical protein
MSWAAALAAALCCAGAARALGATPAPGGGPGAAASSVAVIRPAPGDPVLEEASVRIRSELDASGTRNRLVDCPGPGTPERRECVDSSSAAWISLFREEGIATIQVMASLSDGLELRRHVRVPPETGGEDPSVLAVRAVELLRDIYLDIPRVVRRPESAATPAGRSPQAADGAGTPPTRFSGRAFIGGAALQGRRGLGAAAGPVFGFGISFATRLTLLASVAGPFEKTFHTASAGVDTSQTLASLDLRYEVGPGRFRPYATAGVGLYAKHVEVESTSSLPGVTGPTSSSLAPLIAVGVGVIARVFPWLAVTLDIQEVAILPTQDVTVQDPSTGTTVIGRAGPSDLIELGIVLCPP